CEISREEFDVDPLIQGNKRTVQSYSDHVQASDGQSSSSGGVKFDSLFNTLTYFHVCQPGLPPCLGHDLFEETQLKIISKLQSSGLLLKEDLKYVQKEDIADLLPIIQLRKLMDAFKQDRVTLNMQVISTSTSMSSALSESSSSDTPPHSSSSQQSATEIFSSQAGNSNSRNIPFTWPETFQGPWKKMPQEIRSAVLEGKNLNQWRDARWCVPLQLTLRQPSPYLQVLT
ncbi:hypothetical protein QTP70_029095, partial [Hemibagrus guttatus]